MYHKRESDDSQTLVPIPDSTQLSSLLNSNDTNHVFSLHLTVKCSLANYRELARLEDVPHGTWKLQVVAWNRTYIQLTYVKGSHRSKTLLSNRRILLGFSTPSCTIPSSSSPELIPAWLVHALENHWLLASNSALEGLDKSLENGRVHESTLISMSGLNNYRNDWKRLQEYTVDDTDAHDVPSNIVTIAIVSIYAHPHLCNAIMERWAILLAWLCEAWKPFRYRLIDMQPGSTTAQPIPFQSISNLTIFITSFGKEDVSWPHLYESICDIRNLHQEDAPSKYHRPGATKIHRWKHFDREPGASKWLHFLLNVAKALNLDFTITQKKNQLPTLEDLQQVLGLNLQVVSNEQQTRRNEWIELQRPIALNIQDPLTQQVHTYQDLNTSPRVELSEQATEFLLSPWISRKHWLYLGDKILFYAFSRQYPIKQDKKSRIERIGFHFLVRDATPRSEVRHVWVHDWCCSDEKQDRILNTALYWQDWMHFYTRIHSLGLEPWSLVEWSIHLKWKRQDSVPPPKKHSWITNFDSVLQTYSFQCTLYVYASDICRLWSRDLQRAQCKPGQVLGSHDLSLSVRSQDPSGINWSSTTRKRVWVHGLDPDPPRRQSAAPSKTPQSVHFNQSRLKALTKQLQEKKDEPLPRVYTRIPIQYSYLDSDTLLSKPILESIYLDFYHLTLDSFRRRYPPRFWIEELFWKSLRNGWIGWGTPIYVPNFPGLQEELKYISHLVSDPPHFILEALELSGGLEANAWWRATQEVETVESKGAVDDKRWTQSTPIFRQANPSSNSTIRVCFLPNPTLHPLIVQKRKNGIPSLYEAETPVGSSKKLAQTFVPVQPQSQPQPQPHPKPREKTEKKVQHKKKSTIRLPMTPLNPTLVHIQALETVSALVFPMHYVRADTFHPTMRQITQKYANNTVKINLVKEAVKNGLRIQALEKWFSDKQKKSNVQVFTLSNKSLGWEYKKDMFEQEHHLDVRETIFSIESQSRIAREAQGKIHGELAYVMIDHESMAFNKKNGKDEEMLWNTLIPTLFHSKKIVYRNTQIIVPITKHMTRVLKEINTQAQHFVCVYDCLDLYENPLLASTQEARSQYQDTLPFWNPSIMNHQAKPWNKKLLAAWEKRSQSGKATDESLSFFYSVRLYPLPALEEKKKRRDKKAR
jgi:hypothetical protein